MTASPASAASAAALREEPADPAGPARAPLPVTVIGGYLGAGKTTLVNRWLRSALAQGRQVAVLVNDFGELGIDADLIVAARDDVLELAGGCVCCSFGSDLIGALLALRARQPAPDQVLIETSGVALPGPVAQAARLARDVVVGPVLVLVDALSVIERAHDRYVGDTITRQLAQAGRLLVSRTDLADPQRRAAVWQWLADAAPDVPVAVAADEAMPDARAPARGAADFSALALAPALAPAPARARGLRAGARARPRRPLAPGAPRAGQVFESLSARFAQPLDAPALASALDDPALGLERVKALVTGLDGARWLIELAGGRITCQATDRQPSDRQPDGTVAAARGDRLVGIGTRSRLDRAALTRLIEEFGGRIAGQSR